MLLDPVIARLGDQVADLRGRIEQAADLAALVDAKALPAQTPAAFVLPLGFRAGPADAATGMFTQKLTDSIGVVLVVRVAGDAKGAKAQVRVDALVEQVLFALAGWDFGEFGVFVPVSGDLISLLAGGIMFQVTFSLQRQLRIAR